MPSPLSILIVAPHPDDAELGMGGTIARLASQGHRVLIVDMTDGEPTPMGDPATRAREAAAAAKALGVDRLNLGLTNRRVMHSIEARHALAAVIRKHQAPVMFVPHSEDAHPDHMAVTRIAEDARFDAKLTKTDLAGSPIYPAWLFHYYCSHLRAVPSPTFCIDITGFEDAKRRAVLAYESQFVRNETNRRIVDWVESAGRFFGSRIGTAAAEPFFSREPLGLGSLDSIVMPGVR